MSDFFEDYKGEIASAVSFVIVWVLVIAISVWYSSTQCSAKTAQMGFDSRWGFMSGCMIEVNPDQWIPLDSYYFKQE